MGKFRSPVQQGFPQSFSTPLFSLKANGGDTLLDSSTSIQIYESQMQLSRYLFHKPILLEINYLFFINYVRRKISYLPLWTISLLSPH